MYATCVDQLVLASSLKRPRVVEAAGSESTTVVVKVAVGEISAAPVAAPSPSTNVAI